MRAPFFDGLDLACGLFTHKLVFFSPVRTIEPKSESAEMTQPNRRFETKTPVGMNTMLVDAKLSERLSDLKGLALNNVFTLSGIIISIRFEVNCILIMNPVCVIHFSKPEYENLDQLDRISGTNLPPLFPRYNIAPPQSVLAIIQRVEREAAFLLWGLIPSWSKTRRDSSTRALRPLRKS